MFLEFKLIEFVDDANYSVTPEIAEFANLTYDRELGCAIMCFKEGFHSIGFPMSSKEYIYFLGTVNDMINKGTCAKCTSAGFIINHSRSLEESRKLIKAVKGFNAGKTEKNA